MENWNGVDRFFQHPDFLPVGDSNAWTEQLNTFYIKNQIVSLFIRGNKEL